MKKILSSAILLYFFITISIFSQKPYETSGIETLKKTTGSPSRTHYNINKISTWIYNNGNQDIQPDGNSGFEYPKGSGKSAVYESGIVWGGTIEGKYYVGGSTYEQGFVGGRILEDGTSQNPVEENVRIYRVRPDYSYANLTSELEDGGATIEEIRSQYEKDWNEWPAEFGAPFNDIDSDGIFDPTKDIPGIPDAHQTIWYVANDFDTATSRNFYGSDPMKLEQQVTIWGYNNPQSIYDNVMFKKYKIINKNKYDITDMYVSQWADPDIGDAGDDFVGCDTLLNLAYCYNGDPYDGTYGLAVPAVGFQLLQGPIVEASFLDTAFFDNYPKPGYENLTMKTHFFFIGGDPVYNDPDLGHYNTGALQWHNLFRGLISTTGSPFINPATSNFTKFTLSGDPISKTGWIDGMLHPPGDRRHGFATGPFSLALGDTQEVVIAQFAAMGTDHLNSITLLKNYASILKRDYPTLFYNPNEPDISQLVPELELNETSSDDIIEFSIITDAAIENFSELGYAFQGYNIYQLPDGTSGNITGKRIFTYDIVDDVTDIFGEIYDPLTGEFKTGLLIEGSNSGIPEYVTIDQDYRDSTVLLKGRKYYFGISAYFYNSDPSAEKSVIESSISQIGTIYKDGLPGPNYLDQISASHSSGGGDITALIKVVNPDELTGDTYEITFGRQYYYLNQNGEWIKTNYPDSVGAILNKPSDQTLSTLVPMPSIYAANQTLDLHFEVELNAPDFNWADGVRINFPDGIQINSANTVESNHTVWPNINGQTITWGFEDTTADGAFIGGENLTININYTDPTFSVDYEIFDDGWSKFHLDNTDPPDPTYYNLGNGTVNGKGTVNLTGELGYQFKTENYWDVTNKTEGILALGYQTILSEYDINTGQKAEYGYEPIVDGFRIKLTGSFKKPRSFKSISVNGELQTTRLNLGERLIFTNYSITDYTFFGTDDGTSFAQNGYGTTSVNKLSQDYEFRFTGEKDSVTINSNKVYITKDGTGSLATLYGARQYDILDHPLNNSNTERFLARIPFEVWNKDSGRQVNYQFYDRSQWDTAADGFYVWNPYDRMYGEILNTPYSEQLITVEMTQTLSDEFTWMNVWYESNWTNGDMVEINYANPISLTDVITFNSLDIITGLNSESIVDNYKLSNNYPNPFNPSTKIVYSIPKEGFVNISVYNIIGQKVSQLVDKHQKAGKYETIFNGSNLASGVYIYRISTGNFVQSKKMILLK